MLQSTSDSSKQPNVHAQDVSPFPPELLQLLKEAIPLLCASKRDTLLFFQSVGVPESWLVDMKKQVDTCRTSITKCSIANDVLEKLILKDQDHVRELHETVRRVTEFEDFSACWPALRPKAMELVSEVRRVASVKEAFTAICVDTPA